MIANGMPIDRITCPMINASVGFFANHSTTSAGTSVTMRHAHIGALICNRPCMISEPAYVPTDVELRLDASSPMEKIVPITGPSAAAMACCAPSIESVPVTPYSEFAARISNARFTVPASSNAHATSILLPCSNVLMSGFFCPAA